MGGRAGGGEELDGGRAVVQAGADLRNSMGSLEPLQGPGCKCAPMPKLPWVWCRTSGLPLPVHFRIALPMKDTIIHCTKNTMLHTVYEENQTVYEESQQLWHKLIHGYIGSQRMAS